MAFVDYQQEVVGKVVEQTEGTYTGSAPVEVAAVVLNAGTVAQFPYHLQIKIGALLQSLGFKWTTHIAEVVHLLHEVVLDLVDGVL